MAKKIKQSMKITALNNKTGILYYAKYYGGVCVIKVIRKFFLTHNKSFRWHLGDYEKHNFFLFEGL